jgi:hypothetical protein
MPPVGGKIQFLLGVAGCSENRANFLVSGPNPFILKPEWR